MSYHSLFYTYKDQSPWTETGTNLICPLIVAMSEMGISSTQIRSLIREYEKEHLPVRLSGAETPPVTKENWRSYLGQKEYYQGFVAFFAALIEREPETIRQYFAAIADGIYSDGLTGLIRLGYAFESGEQGEVARALAFLAAGYRPLYFELPPAETKLFVEQIISLQTVRPDRKQSFQSGRLPARAETHSVSTRGRLPARSDYSLSGGSFDQRLSQIAENRDYLDTFARLEEENLNIYTLRAIAIRLARETGAESMKYLFCAVHAFRVIAPLFSDLPARIQQFYLMIQAAYLAADCPPLQPAEESALKNWSLIFSLSAFSRSAANLFFIYSCYREDQFAPSPIYAQMAYQTIHQEMEVKE